MDPRLGVDLGFRLSERHPRGVPERLTAPRMIWFGWRLNLYTVAMLQTDH